MKRLILMFSLIILVSAAIPRAALGQYAPYTPGEWTDVTNVPPGSHPMHGVFMLDDSTGYAVGDGPPLMSPPGWVDQGVLLKTSNGGTIWNDYTTTLPADPVARALRGVVFKSRTDGWICGTKGLIVHTSNAGANWVRQANGLTNNDLVKIAFSDLQHGYAVGRGGTIAVTSDGGTNWSLKSSPATGIDLRALCAVGATVYAAGPQGTVIKSQDFGQTWANAGFTNPTWDIQAMYFTDASNGYMSAGAGTIYKTYGGGNLWQQILVDTSSTNGIYTAITFSSASNGYFFQADTAVFFTNNGGLAGKWFRNTPPATGQTIYDAHFPSTNIGYAVGGTTGASIIKWDGRYPLIWKNKSSQDLGIHLCDNSAQDTVIISNIGTKDLTISGAYFDGPNAPEFSVLSPVVNSITPYILPPGGTVPFVVQWNGTGWGKKTGTLVVDSDSPIWAPPRIKYTVQKDSSGFRTQTNSVKFDPTCLGTSVVQYVSTFATGNIAPTITSITQVSGDTVFKVFTPVPPVVATLGNSPALGIRFTPNDYKVFAATFRITTQPCNRQILLNVTGVGAITYLALYPQSGVDVGKVEVGDSTSVKFQVRNTGNTSASVIDFKFDPPVPGLFIPDKPSFPWTFGAGGSQEFTIKFKPDSIRIANTTLCIIWDKPCPDTVCFAVTGRSVMEPKIVRPGIVTFDSLLCGTEALKTFYVHNAGHGPLVIRKAEIRDYDKNNFDYVDPGLPVTVDPGDSVEITVRFHSTTAGNKTTALYLTHNDSARSPSIIPLVGVKNELLFTVEGDTIAYRRVCITDSALMRFDVRNNGSTTLTLKNIREVSGSNAFTFRPISFPVDIAAKQALSFTAVFRPPAQGFYTAKFEFDGDPCAVQTVLGLGGIGVKTDFRASPTPVQFGDVKVGGSAQAKINVNNVGSNAQISGYAFVPPVPGLSLSPLPTFPIPWPTNMADSMTIVYAPTGVGTVATTLKLFIQSECPDTLRIPILARATSTYIAVNRNTLPIAVSPCDQSGACDTVRISNTGSSDLLIQNVAIDQAKNIFTLSPVFTPPLVITAGRSFLFTVCAGGRFVGTETAKLVITSDDPQRPVIEVPLSASRDSVRISAAVAGIDFGHVTRCDSTHLFTFPVTNSGTLADSVTMISGDPAFIIQTPSPVRLNPGDTKQVQVLFAPKSNGAFSSTLTLRTRLCNTLISIPARGIRDVVSYAMNPSPLNFGDISVGTPATRTIAVTAGHGIGSRITRISFQPPASAYASGATLPLTIDSMGTVNIPITFTPPDTGVFRVSACMTFDLPCTDTICISLLGRGVRGDLRISDTQVAFGEAAQCQQKRDTITVTNAGNQSVSLTGSTITGSGSAYFSIANPVSGSENLAAGGSRSFFILFNSAAAPDGAYNANLRITSTDPQRPTIDVPLSGTRTTQTLPAIPLANFGLVILGQTQTNQIVIRNNGTAEFCIRSVAGGVRFTTNISLPQCIKPGQQILLPVAFFPVDTQTVNETLRLIVDTPCADSIRVPLTGKGAQGVVSQTLQVSLGTIASCRDAQDTIRITNNGNAPITYQSAAISGANAAQVTIVSAPTPPKDILPGGQELIVVRFAPGGQPDGAKTAAVQTTILVNGQPQTFITQITANVVTPRFTLTNAAFPQTVIGNSQQQTITVTNSSLLPIAVTQVRVADPAFTITGMSQTPPMTVPPGGSFTVTVRFSPTTAKIYSAPLECVSTSPCALTYQNAVTGEGILPNIIQATLAIPAVTGAPKDRVLVPILLQTDLGLADVRSYGGTVRFNRTMLFPQRILTANTLSQNMTANFTYDHTTGTVSIDVAGGALAAGTGTLILLECEVLIGDNDQTPIAIGGDFDFTSGRAAVASRLDGMFRLEGYCLCDGTRLMKTDGLFRLWQNYPNPFNPSTEIQYSLAEDGIAVLAVRDALGREIVRLVDGWQKAGVHRALFDAGALTGGVYYYTLLSGRFFDAKKMIVTK